MRRVLAATSLFAPALLALALVAPPSPAHAYQFISSAGCSPGLGAAWKFPTNWYLNSSGYSRLPFADMEAVMKAGVEVWTSPCCSSFASVYQGTASESAMGNSPKNIVSFFEDTWPRELGGRRSTIAVTLVQSRPDCSIAFSDMVFNGVGFTFRLGSDTDLQAIATHEFGHWLGLDHTSTRGSTMLPYYQGGTSGRALGPDDEAGVCALYPGWCEGCEEDADCPPGRDCDNGACVIPSCAVNADCATGFFCSAGSCLPGCRTHLECGEDESCERGVCRAKPTGCTICDTCSTDADCGTSRSYRCVDLGTGSNVCTKFCSDDSDCDGDSTCYQFGSGQSSFQLCFAPGATDETDVCPASYQCQADGPAPALTCTKLWDVCPANADGCGGRSDFCVPTGLNSKCSCTCRADDECGEGARCLTDPVTGTQACYPDTLIEECGNTFCPPGLGCRDDACIPTCMGFLCERSEICLDDECVSACESCPTGTICDGASAKCVPVDRCAGMVCASGSRCVDGACLEGGTCENVSCADGLVCRDDACVKADAGSSKGDGGCSGCASGEAGLSLLGALALGAAALRRRRGREGSRSRA